MKDTLFMIAGILFATLVSIVVVAWVIFIFIMQLLADNLKWLILAGTALTLGYWYL